MQYDHWYNIEFDSRFSPKGSIGGPVQASSLYARTICDFMSQMDSMYKVMCLIRLFIWSSTRLDMYLCCIERNHDCFLSTCRQRQLYHKRSYYINFVPLFDKDILQIYFMSGVNLHSCHCYKM